MKNYKKYKGNIKPIFGMILPFCFAVSMLYKGVL